MDAHLTSPVRAAASLLGALLLAAGLALGVPVPATASSIVVLVNDEPITEYDVAQRTRLLSATGGGGRETAIEELIEETLKLQSARRLSVTVMPAEIDQAFGSIAGSANLSPSQFNQALGQIGVNPETLKKRIEADLAWRDVVRSQLRQEITIRQSDVQAALAERGEEGQATTTELTMRQVIFSIPSGSSDAYIQQRRREANAFRTAFTSCETAVETAQAFKDTVVHSEVHRSLSDFPENVRSELGGLQPGQASAPNVTDSAVEVIAVCSREEVRDDTAARNDIQGEMVNEQGQRLARRLMIDLKQAAIIEYR